MNINSNFGLTFNLESGESYKLEFQEVKHEAENTVLIDGRKFKVVGNKNDLEKFNACMQKLPKEFKTVKEFKASLELQGNTDLKKIRKAATVQFSNTESELIKKTIGEIHQSKGTKQEIKRILTEMGSEKKNLPLLMDIATTLIRNGDSIKASHFFYFIQLNLSPDERYAAMPKMGQAFFEYGKKHLDATAFDLALLHGLTPQQSQETKVCLQKIASTKNVNEKNYARELLDSMQINELLVHVIESVDTPEALEDLKAKDPDVRKAFELAAKMQERIDIDTSPELAAPGKIVTIEGTDHKSIPMHVNIVGTRKQLENGQKEPVVIFESGLGCFSADWRFTQENLPADVQSMSYDRAGMGWSGDDGAEPTAERTLSNLEALLDKCNLSPPYIFVGHSYGGILGQIFALRHPDKVVGLVLVDAGIEHIMPNQPEEPDPNQKPFVSVTEYLPPVVAGFAVNDHAHAFEDKIARNLHRIIIRSPQSHTFEGELAGYRTSGELLQKEIRESKSSQPIKSPLKVITAGLYDINEDKIFTEKEKAASKEWFRSQAKLQERSANSIQIIAEKSDHQVMHHEPEVIARQVLTFYKRA